MEWTYIDAGPFDLAAPSAGSFRRLVVLRVWFTAQNESGNWKAEQVEDKRLTDRLRLRNDHEKRAPHSSR